MTVWLRDPACTGTETELRECPGVQEGEMSWGDVGHGKDVQVICYNKADVGEEIAGGGRLGNGEDGGKQCENE